MLEVILIFIVSFFRGGVLVGGWRLLGCCGKIGGFGGWIGGFAGWIGVACGSVVGFRVDVALFRSLSVGSRIVLGSCCGFI